MLFCRVRTGYRYEGLRTGRRCEGVFSAAPSWIVGVAGSSSLDFKSFDPFDFIVLSLLVNDLANFKEGDGNGE